MPRVSADGVRVGRVDYGRGVFAVRRFRRDETIGEVTGRIFDDPENGSNHCIDLGDNFSLEPAAPFRYLNHSCTPNCQLVLVEPEHLNGHPVPWRAVVDATRTILPGDELTIDYAWPADSAVPCLCGSERCRGWIVDRRELRKLARVNGHANGRSTARAKPR